MNFQQPPFQSRISMPPTSAFASTSETEGPRISLGNRSRTQLSPGSLANSSFQTTATAHSPSTNSNDSWLKVWKLMKRLIKFRQMDFELALWQMMWLVVSPRRVYKNIYYHKQTKNQWARDDPAFMVLLTLGIALMGLVYSLYFKLWPVHALSTICYMIFVDYFLLGYILSTVCWFLSNKFLLSRHMIHSNPEQVEWLYAGDVHSNSVFCYYLLTSCLQFCLLPLFLSTDIAKNTTTTTTTTSASSIQYQIQAGWFGLIVGNVLYAIASSWYWYITFLGYSALPFLKNTVIFLFPAFISVIASLVCTLTGVSISQLIMSLYFTN